MIRHRQASPALFVCCLFALGAILLTVASVASAGVVSPALRSADHARDRSDRALVSKVHKQRNCTRSTSGRCRAYRRAMQRAGRKLARAERRFAHKSVVTQRRARLHGRQTAPRLRGKNGRLRWSKVADIHSYLVIRKAAGMASSYSVVKSAALKPPAVPGQKVTYRVRTAVKGSAWSAPLPVSYAPKPRKDPVSAPIVTVSGTKLSWSRVGRVRDYVVRRRIAGRPDVYSAVRGTSAAVTPVPGVTATYSVRTAVTGSASAPSASITFPAASGPAPSPVLASAASASAPSPASATSGFQVGIGMRVWEDNDRAAWNALRPKRGTPVRFEFSATNPTSGDKWVDFYAGLGATPQPMAGFSSIPSNAQVDALAAWARSKAGRIKLIEFGNESYIQQSTQGGAYALAAKRLAQDLAGSGVGVLVQADDNNTSSSWWVDAMYAAVPDLQKYAAGWVIHPYGGNGDHLKRVNRVWGYLQARGADPAVKFYATEYGIATDNGGSALQPNNYDWPQTISYADAGTALRRTVADFKASGKVAEVMLYQSTDQQAPGGNQREAYFGLLRTDGTPKGGYTQAAIDLLAG